jgi:prepilin-type N-terminal cleavage/methylation domain-containing protein
LDFGRKRAFTLIELLIVIAIIAILAAMIIPITSAVKRVKLRSRTEKELRQVETAIELYKTKHGFYPPDNPGATDSVNPLFYELTGTTNNGSIFTTLDRSASIDPASIQKAFNKPGFMNTMQGKAGDEGIIAENFLKGGIRADQVATITENGAKVNILVGTVGWPSDRPGNPLSAGPAPGTFYNPWRYNSTNPTNNPGKYDLWIDIFVDGKTNRFSNWETTYKTL